jgi:signal transduction histidine kinase
MSGAASIRLQTALVVVLFLGSFGTLLFVTYTTLALPERELQLREELRAAGQDVAEAAAPVVEGLPGGDGARPDELRQPLREAVAGVLRRYPGVEGGFYLAGGLDRFVAAVPPDGPAAPPGPHPPPGPPAHDEPPPKEEHYILLQARQSLDLGPDEARVEVHDVPPSRVVILTRPVGRARPARLVLWLMCRLTGPEQLEAKVHGYQLSAGLALGGIALALLLTWNVGRTLRRQRREQDQLREELRRAEHLAALGKLLAGVAHEVRTPLAGIRSTVQLWQRLPDTARTPGSLDAVIGAVDRLNGIVSRLLYFSRADSAERQPVDVNQVLREALGLLAAQAAEQGVALDEDLAADLPPVSGSAGALRQVALNLLTNALQAMPHGGQLRCRTRFLAAEGQVEVLVSDTGPGISAEDRRHLFEPFFTTRPEGTGLGLALCREIVTNHGGRIEYEAGAAQGATFRVVLPAAAPPAG